MIDPLDLWLIGYMKFKRENNTTMVRKGSGILGAATSSQSEQNTITTPPTTS